ncbi:MAG: AMIN domain-containing protein [Desulfuromonadaceae bacterium]
MKLEHPERIAIDIPDAGSSLTKRTIPINRFGVSNARVGRNKGFLRIVLDTKLRTFPPFRVSPSASGLLVEFTQ